MSEHIERARVNLDRLMAQVAEQVSIIENALEDAQAEVEAAVLAERERCAKLADQIAIEKKQAWTDERDTAYLGGLDAAQDIAEKIRSGK